MQGLGLNILWAGCMPKKSVPEEANYNDKLLSFAVEDEEPTIVEKPPYSLLSQSRCPGSMMIEPNAHMPRTGLVPKRTNFARKCEQIMNIDFSKLADPDWEQRRKAVAHLGSCFLGRHPGEFNQEAANIIIPALRAAMRDEQPEVRAQAATSLSSLGPEVVWHAVPVLWEACSDPDEPVRRAALEALTVHGQEAPPQHLRQARLRLRSWQEPPSLRAVREDPREDCQSECSLLQEEVSTTAHSDESSRPSSQFSTRDGGSDLSGDRSWNTVLASEFTMSFYKPSDLSLLGLDVDTTHKGCLKVLEIHDGVINDWNNRYQAKEKLERGDLIVEINGYTGSPRELLQMLKENSWLEVAVQRHRTAV
jgi:hypothetical protein